MSLHQDLLGRHVTNAVILIVDDDEGSRITTSGLLTGKDNEIHFASSGTEAIEKARDLRPDLILLDIMMPEMDGYEVCKRLRAEPDIADVRVFMLTALDDRQSRLRGFEAGADDFITKPINREEAMARIQGIARLNRYRLLVGHHRHLRSLTHIHTPSKTLSGHTQAELEKAFNKSLETASLVYQPIVNLNENNEKTDILAYEALLRTESDLLSDPLSVLAASVLLNRQEEVSRRVRQCAANAFEQCENLNLLFVNLNAHDLCDEHLLSGDESINQYAHKVVYEITEREPISDVRDIRHSLKVLREKGFRFALDDLGGGYSSLNSFAVIEPEFVKLDRDLVHGVESEEVRKKIISSILSLCDELKITLLVEGVETASEKELLRELGCVYQQGYFHAKPSKSI